MGSTTDQLTSAGLIRPPKFLKNNIQYEVMTGSFAYGVPGNSSDIDIYGFCIPTKDIIFPHLRGEILGFGKPTERFEQYQQHHINDSEYKKEYDINIYNIVKYFQLAMDMNPNMIDSLFVPIRCILHQTQVGEHVRSNRKLFLSKKCYYKFKGYAYSQLHKMKTKAIREFIKFCDSWNLDPYIDINDGMEIIRNGSIGNPAPAIELFKSLIKQIETNGNRSKRIESVIKYGFDVKFAYHVVRLLDESRQLLEEGDLDIEKSKEHLKAIRRGEVKEEEVIEYFNRQEKSLQALYDKSKLRHSPDESAIKKLLLECLEMHYGSLDNAIKKESNLQIDMLHDLRGLISKYERIE